MPAKLLYGQVQRSAMNWPFFVAQERQFFAEENLTVEATIFTSGREPVAGLINGSLDVINVIPDVALLEMEKGASLSLIANTNTRPEYTLMVHPTVRDFKNLKGEKIGVNDSRSAEGLIFKKIAEKKGLSPDAYELVGSGPPPERCERLKQGLLAATMVTQPFDFALREAGFKTLASSPEIVPYYPFTVCVVQREEKINEEIVRFLSSLKNAWQWLADPINRESAIAILVHSTETAVKQAEATYDLYLKSPSPPSLVPSHEGVATMMELLVESGRLSPPPPPPQKFIDERYIKTVES